MSNPGTYRTPTWSGLGSKPFEYVAADPAMVQQLTAAIKLDGSVRQLANVGGTPSAFLRFDPVDGSRPLFLKVVETRRANDLAEAESIARWLADQGVRVVSASFHGQLASGFEFWAYPFHSGRPPEPIASDLTAIGLELGKLHEALSRSPLVGEWERQTDARLARLSSIREALVEGSLQAGPAPTLLQAVARDRTIDFLPERFAASGNRLPLHGDLNRFNILIDDDGCTFLDFEDVKHSFLSPIFDLAMVFERVVLVNQSADKWSQAFSALFGAYAKKTGIKFDANWLPITLKGMALRSLCTLAEIDRLGSDAQEWKKFFQLLALAEAHFDTRSNGS